MFLLWHPSLTAIKLSYTFPILETSATALRGTPGILGYYIKKTSKFAISQNLFIGRTTVNKTGWSACGTLHGTNVSSVDAFENDFPVPFGGIC